MPRVQLLGLDAQKCAIQCKNGYGSVKSPCRDTCNCLDVVQELAISDATRALELDPGDAVSHYQVRNLFGAMRKACLLWFHLSTSAEMRTGDSNDGRRQRMTVRRPSTLNHNFRKRYAVEVMRFPMSSRSPRSLLMHIPQDLVLFSCIE